MSTKTDESADLMPSLTEEPQCEGEWHPDGTHGHIADTPAAWLIRWQCPKCLRPPIPMLLCDGRFQWWMLQDEVENDRCGHISPIHEAMISAVRL